MREYTDFQRPITLVIEELFRATAKHGPFISSAVGLAGIVEEVGELAEALLKGKPNAEVRGEAIQIAAMGLRFVMDCCPEEKDDEEREVLEKPPDFRTIRGLDPTKGVLPSLLFPPPPGQYPMEIYYQGQPPILMRVTITEVDEGAGTFKMIPEPGYCPHATLRQCNHPQDPVEYTDDCGLTDSECDFEDSCEDYEKCWRYQRDRAELLERHRKMLVNVVRMARRALAPTAESLRPRLRMATRGGKTTVLAHDACVRALEIVGEETNA